MTAIASGVGRLRFGGKFFKVPCIDFGGAREIFIVEGNDTY